MSRTALRRPDDRMRQLPQGRAPNGAHRASSLHELSRAPRREEPESVQRLSRRRSENGARHARVGVPELPPSTRSERSRGTSGRGNVTRLHVVPQGWNAAGPSRRDQAPGVHDVSLRSRRASRYGSADVPQLSQRQNRALPERRALRKLSLVHAAALKAAHSTANVTMPSTWSSGLTKLTASAATFS